MSNPHPTAKARVCVWFFICSCFKEGVFFHSCAPLYLYEDVSCTVLHGCTMLQAVVQCERSCANVSAACVFGKKEENDIVTFPFWMEPVPLFLPLVHVCAQLVRSTNVPPAVWYSCIYSNHPNILSPFLLSLFSSSPLSCPLFSFGPSLPADNFQYGY